MRTSACQRIPKVFHALARSDGSSFTTCPYVGTRRNSRQPGSRYCSTWGPGPLGGPGAMNGQSLVAERGRELVDAVA